MRDDGTKIDGKPEQKPKRKRGNPAWVKGGPSPNPGGLPEGYGAFRDLCRSCSPEAITALRAALSTDRDVQAARVLLEYGWGKPSSAPEDLEAVREANPLAGVTVEMLRALAGRDEE